MPTANGPLGIHAAPIVFADSSSAALRHPVSAVSPAGLKRPQLFSASWFHSGRDAPRFRLSEFPTGVHHAIEKPLFCLDFDRLRRWPRSSSAAARAADNVSDACVKSCQGCAEVCHRCELCCKKDKPECAKGVKHANISAWLVRHCASSIRRWLSIPVCCARRCAPVRRMVREVDMECCKTCAATCRKCAESCKSARS